MVTDLVVDLELFVPYLKILYYGGVGISKKYLRGNFTMKDVLKVLTPELMYESRLRKLTKRSRNSYARWFWHLQVCNNPVVRQNAVAPAPCDDFPSNQYFLITTVFLAFEQSEIYLLYHC